MDFLDLLLVTAIPQGVPFLGEFYLSQIPKLHGCRATILEQYLSTGWTKLEYRYSKYLVLFGPYLSIGLNWTKFSPWTKLDQMWENSDHLNPWTIFYS